MFLRPEPTITLDQLTTNLHSRSGVVETVPLRDVKFNLTAARPSIGLGAGANNRYPASPNTVHNFAEFLGVPPAFLKKISAQAGTEVGQYVLEKMLETAGGEALSVRISDTEGITGVFEKGKAPMDPYRLARVIQNVIGTGDAPIVRLVDVPSELAFDVAVPEGYDRGTGGDPAVGDFTCGGIRTTLDLKRGLTPKVQPFAYRLACTNGYEMEDDLLKVDGRGLTVDEVLNDIEEMAQRAFGHIEDYIAHLYDLRDVPVDNPERTIRAISREQNIPARTTMAMIDMAATEDLPDNPSMFDVTNLITNFANSPSLRNDGGRILLERAGGAVINDHSTRCAHCAQKVTT